MNNKMLWLVVGIVLIGGVAFYGGMTYSSAHAAGSSSFSRGAGFTSGAVRMGNRGNGGLAAGEVIAKDSTSVTIQLPNGAGTKIVLLSPTTPVMKTVDGALSDITVGTTIVANGTANSDGSITAQSIQIRPAGSSAFFGQGGGSQTGGSPQGAPVPGSGSGN